MPGEPQFKTWQEMLEHNRGLLLRRTGHDVAWWLAEARAQASASEADTRRWLVENGVSGYAQNPIMWELYGYPDFFLKDAVELLDGQYADRPALRPIADAVIALTLAWAEDGTANTQIQLRKTYFSLTTPRRKFAQVTPVSKSAVDIFLRLDAPAVGRLEIVKVRAGDPFQRKVRLREVGDVDASLAEILLRAYAANS
ncbi:hypothetical protein MB46_17130 [Arthrobacter alpinus]|uniref:hypothetical protein n=1 Tax=Arthrobacter alpinus TaxID=656366 RepID=UPI0005C9974E|nr:hypothetical protein [Arthrobacter alpinus]ALV46946.1 hypothetical protein MB46_17130 [Arthrobacter alpinus]